MDDRIVIAAVADGHGAPAYTRSEVGSRIAAEVAIELLRALFDGCLDDTDEAPPFSNFGESVTRLAGRIAWVWNQRVKEDARQRGEDPGTDDGEISAYTRPYGTTLLAAAFSDSMGVLLQIGDGDIVLIGEDGTASIMFPSAPEHVGIATASLCSRNAASKIRVKTLDLQVTVPRLVVLSTDGLSDSVAGEGEFLQVAPWFLRRIEEDGFASLLGTLPAWLYEISDGGVGDDVSVGLVCWVPDSLNPVSESDASPP